MKKTKHSIGSTIVESLTSDQVERLLDILLKNKDLSSYMDELRQVDEDMAETMERIVKKDAPDTGKRKSRHTASSQKNLEVWDNLWDRWDEKVSEVGDEEGSYAVQEAHWEPPYFDGDSLADDLEPIAEEMLDLIDDIFALVKEPKLFLSELQSLNSRIHNYPELMGVEEQEPCELKKSATRCVLKWEWNAAVEEAHRGRTLLHKIYEYQDELDMVSLDKQECLDFFTSLPEKACREIYSAFVNGELKKEMKDIDSIWYRIRHACEKRFDPSRYLETCRAHLNENWHYGKPLIVDALAKGNLKDAETLLKKTFKTILSHRKIEEWVPESALFLEHYRYHYQDSGDEIPGLLDIWAVVAGNRGNRVRFTASLFQSVILRNPENWEIVIDNYAKLEKFPQIDSLLGSWKDEMVLRTMQDSAHDRERYETWIHWLIDASIEQKTEPFRKKLEQWLESLESDRNLFRKRWKLLSLLTKDLPESGEIARKYPTFHAVVLPKEDGASILDNNRRQALVRASKGFQILKVLSVWQKCLADVMPDPGAGGPDYSREAKWAKALYEMNLADYQRITLRWREKYRQRRNLWRDMKSENLPF